MNVLEQIDETRLRKLKRRTKTVLDNCDEILEEADIAQGKKGRKKGKRGK